MLEEKEGLADYLQGKADRGILSEGFLSRIAQMFCMQLRIHLEPLVWRAILVFLEICDEIIEDIDKVVLEVVTTDKAFRPDEKSVFSCRGEGKSNGDVDELRWEKSVQYTKCILELCIYMEELGFAAVQRLDDTFNVLLNVPIPQGLVAMQISKEPFAMFSNVG